MNWFIPKRKLIIFAIFTLDETACSYATERRARYISVFLSPAHIMQMAWQEIVPSIDYPLRC